MMPPATPRPEQLRMVWPEGRPPPRFRAPVGYRLRPLRADEAGEHQRLLLGAGFANWTPERTAEARSRALPGCFLAVEHRASGRPVATAMAGSAPLPGWPDAVELGWVAGDPAHAGRGLGRAVCAGVLRRLLDAGHRGIYLKTDDFRLAAIRVYLRLGFEPALHAPGMAERWSAILKTLGKGTQAADGVYPIKGGD
jgi:mycothiol synthase